MRFCIRVLSLFLAVILCGSAFVACKVEPDPPAVDSTPDISDIPDTPDTSDTSDTVPPETTEPPVTETDPPETEESSSAEETTESDTTTEETPTPAAPEFVNPITGLEADQDFTGIRPAAIMINNIRVSCPQIGVADADIMYECLVEGGYTRLMMVVMDYANLGSVGSVRSARNYYLDFAADYDALYVNAGGIETSYEGIFALIVQNLDGVNMYLPSTFARDRDRIATMGLEHSLMTTGAGIVSGIKYKKYSTATEDDFDYPLDFVPYGTTVSY